MQWQPSEIVGQDVYIDYIKGTQVKVYGLSSNHETFTKIVIDNKYYIDPINSGINIHLDDIANVLYGLNRLVHEGEDVYAHIVALGAYHLVKGIEGIGRSRAAVHKASKKGGIEPRVLPKSQGICRIIYEDTGMPDFNIDTRGGRGCMLILMNVTLFSILCSLFLIIFLR